MISALSPFTSRLPQQVRFGHFSGPHNGISTQKTDQSVNTALDRFSSHLAAGQWFVSPTDSHSVSVTLPRAKRSDQQENIKIEYENFQAAQTSPSQPSHFKQIRVRNVPVSALTHQIDFTSQFDVLSKKLRGIQNHTPYRPSLATLNITLDFNPDNTLIDEIRIRKADVREVYQNNLAKLNNVPIQTVQLFLDKLRRVIEDAARHRAGNAQLKVGQNTRSYVA
jgi:hypothetical protein